MVENTNCPKRGAERYEKRRKYDGSLVLVCPECNGIKSNFFTFDEMLKIGRIIGEIKKARS